MPDWYRNSEWSPQIAADFEARLARARGQRTQYLSLQGQALIAHHPDIAETLLERAVASSDAFETVRALAFLAQARLAVGKVDGALAAYEEALERQIEHPNVVAVQPADYLFVIGYFRRVDRLASALPIAEALPEVGIFGPEPQALAAKALVFGLAGRSDAARHLAERALAMVDGVAEAAALGISVAGLRRRLAEIVG